MRVRQNINPKISVKSRMRFSAQGIYHALYQHKAVLDVDVAGVAFTYRQFKRIRQRFS